MRSPEGRPELALEQHRHPPTVLQRVAAHRLAAQQTPPGTGPQLAAAVRPAGSADPPGPTNELLASPAAATARISFKKRSLWRSDLSVVRVSGDDRVAWLNDQVTNEYCSGGLSNPMSISGHSPWVWPVSKHSRNDAGTY